MKRICLIILILGVWYCQAIAGIDTFIEATDYIPVTGSKNLLNLRFGLRPLSDGPTDRVLCLGVGIKTSERSKPDYYLSYCLLRMDNFFSHLCEDKADFQIIDPPPDTEPNPVYYLNIGLADNQITSSTKKNVDWARCLVGYGWCIPHGDDNFIIRPFAYSGCTYSTYQADGESREKLKGFSNSDYSGFAVVGGIKIQACLNEHVYVCPQAEIKYHYAGTRILSSKAGLDFSYLIPSLHRSNPFRIDLQLLWNNTRFSKSGLQGGDISDNYPTIQVGMFLPLSFYGK